MEENIKIKLNLTGLKKKNIESQETEDTGPTSEILTQKKARKNIELELNQNTHPPFKVKKGEKIQVEQSEILPLQEIKSGEKMSFAAITGITQEQEKENSKNKMDKENARTETQLEADKKEQNTKNEEEKIEEVKFSNYKSTFKSESENLIKKIQKFRYTPKTRVGFLLTLIMFTGLSIGLLMVIFPDKHSPQIYKASLLEIYNSERKNHSETETIQDTWEEEINELGDEEILVDNENIQDNNSENKGDIQEDSIGEEEQEISEVEREMQRVRNHLLDRYK